MHTYYSKTNQSFEYYGYTIFVAEVASTFNEQLLSQHLLKHAKTKEERAYLINTISTRYAEYHPSNDVCRIRENHSRAAEGR